MNQPISKKLTAPVLFLIFNRPDVTQRVFAEIRRAQPPRLYVAADGPRADRLGEAEKVEQTRQLVLENIDWECEVKTLFRESNLGCRQAVSGAIDWFFAQEEEGIILEDDCLPSQSFFRFCDELLELYNDDKRIMVISGNNFQQGQKRGSYSYYFSQLNHVWGWASWRRAWILNQKSFTSFEEISATSSFHSLTHNKLANQMWINKFRQTYQGKIDSWDYLWTFANLVNHGLTVLPNVNLVTNIGFGPEATHTTKYILQNLVPSKEIEFPLNHPPYIAIDKEADNFTYIHHYNCRPIWKRILRKFLTISRNMVNLVTQKR